MPSSPGYPEQLEQAWLQHAMQITRTPLPRAAVTRLETAAGSLSDAFTTGRDPDFAGYNSSRRALAAYGLFFFPRAYVRTRIVLRECRMRRGTPEKRDVFRVVDLGAGTGAAGLACLHELSEWLPDSRLQLDMIDRASEGMDLSRTIFSAGHPLWPKAQINVVHADARTYQPPYGVDLIICSFAINEWMEQQSDGQSLEVWVTKLMQTLKPGGWLILLEPSLRFAVERMERLRDSVAHHAVARIIAPCPHHAPCPMLAEKRGWCHEVREWNVPESLRWINRTLQRDVHLLKFSMLALENAPITIDDDAPMRLVSPLKKEKGKYVFHGCGQDGQIHTCEWLTRNLSPEQKAASDQLERGDLVKWEKVTVSGDGKIERGDGPPVKENGT